MDQPKTINLDGQTYEVDKFSPGVQQAIFVYNTFAADLQKEQLAVMKTQAALQQIGQQISDAVKKELSDEVGPAEPTATTENIPEEPKV